MTTEQKAKRYDEAIDVARKIKNGEPIDVPDGTPIPVAIFPELKESESERIRKWLIGYFRQYKEDGMEKYANGLKVESVISWLEKQRHDGKKWIYENVYLKAKFNIGDWITNGDYTWRIEDIKLDMYILSSSQGQIVDDQICRVDTYFHLWTIQDAKNGDVLAFDNDTIVIFKNLYNPTSFHSYCHFEDGIFDISKDEMPDWWKGEGFYPATKEQCNILFKKMKEAGYKWNDNKKEITTTINNIKYVLVKLPESEQLVEHERFHECLLICNIDGHDNVGPSAYMCPEDLYNELFG